MAHGHVTAPDAVETCGQCGRLRPLLRIHALAALGHPVHRTARHGACIVFQSTNRFQPSKRRAGLGRCRPDAWDTPFDSGERSCVSPADARDTAPIRRLAQKGKHPPYCPKLNTPRPPQGGSGAGPSNITRHYAKWPHARTSLVNAATSHNAALCVNGPEGVPPTPAGGLAWCGCAERVLISLRWLRVLFDPPPALGSQSKGAPARAKPRAVFRPPFACLPPVRPKGLPQSRLSVPPVLPGMAKRDSARSRLWQG